MPSYRSEDSLDPRVYSPRVCLIISNNNDVQPHRLVVITSSTQCPRIDSVRCGKLARTKVKGRQPSLRFRLPLRFQINPIRTERGLQKLRSALH